MEIRINSATIKNMMIGSAELKQGSVVIVKVIDRGLGKDVLMDDLKKAINVYAKYAKELADKLK